MTRIIFNENFPELAEPKVREIINDFSWMFPAWLQEVKIHYKADNNSAAYINVLQDYRFVNLTICGFWLEESPEKQIEQIIHELIHIHFSPLKNYALETIDTLCEGEDNKLYKIIRDELISKNEQATQDFAFAIANKFHSKQIENEFIN